MISLLFVAVNSALLGHALFLQLQAVFGWDCTFSWWHIHYFLVLDFYPIEGTAIFHSDQLQAVVCSPKFNFILWYIMLSF